MSQRATNLYKKNKNSKEGVLATLLRIINTEDHISLNLLVYWNGHPYSTDTKIGTNYLMYDLSMMS